MKDFISKRLEVAIKKDIKINESLIQALQDDAKQYGCDNTTKIEALKGKNKDLVELLKQVIDSGNASKVSVVEV